MDMAERSRRRLPRVDAPTLLTDELIESSHANFLEAYALVARSLPDGCVEDLDGATCLATGVPEAEFNRAFVFAAPSGPTELIQRVEAFYAELELPWMLVVAEAARPEMTAAATAARLGFGRIIPAMSLEGPDVPGSWPPGLDITPVDGAAMAGVFARTLADGFGTPPAYSAVYAAPGVWDAPGVTSYIGWVDGQPVATAARVVTGAVAGLYNVGTLQGFRRRGIAAALTRRAIEDGRSEVCIATILQSSTRGYSLYRGMGFRQFTSYRAWYRLKHL